MMAQRKDMMRIIRQDAGFSEKLGFGAATTASKPVEEPKLELPTSVEAVAAPKSGAVAVTTIERRPCNTEGEPDERHIEAPAELRKERTGPLAQQNADAKPSDLTAGSAARGQVVYVAVSLTTRQAHLAEAWAMAARCSVQFLIRRVAQSLRDQVFDDWERDGMPEIDESRGTRGNHPTSVTLTLRPQFAAELATRHDPLGVLGLARVMGPAFRERFQEAFDLALAKANIKTTIEGDEK
jgi:hypothetical protein